MQWQLIPSACCVCMQATSNAHEICQDCQQLLEILSNTADNDKQVFSHRWQRFHYLGHYEEILASLLNRGKFKADYATLKQIATLFCRKRLTSSIDNCGVVIPVPMKTSRYLRRGFNQAELLATSIANTFGLGCDLSLVKHSGLGRVQHSLNRQQRKQNMRQAFYCDRPAPQRVYLVDDIYTTGATMNAMCDCLRAQGSEYIEIWVMAITI